MGRYAKMHSGYYSSDIGFLVYTVDNNIILNLLEIHFQFYPTFPLNHATEPRPALKRNAQITG